MILSQIFFTAQAERSAPRNRPEPRGKRAFSDAFRTYPSGSDGNRPEQYRKREAVFQSGFLGLFRWIPVGSVGKQLELVGSSWKWEEKSENISLRNPASMKLPEFLGFFDLGNVSSYINTLNEYVWRKDMATSIFSCFSFIFTYSFDVRKLNVNDFYYYMVFSFNIIILFYRYFVSPTKTWLHDIQNLWHMYTPGIFSSSLLTSASSLYFTVFFYYLTFIICI